MPKYEKIIFALIILIATLFRLHQLDIYPPGLYRDEAMNGNNAIQALETGEFKTFYPENNGREGLFINMQALSIKLFGNTPFALRFVSAILGILTVVGLYLLTRRLFNWQIAAFSSFFLAVSFWHVNFSRIGFRAIMAPMLLVWGLYFFWKGLQNGRILPFAISGIFWGLGFHTYIAFRAMPLALALALFGYWQAVRKDFVHEKYRHALSRIGLGFCVFLIAIFLIISPLVYHFYKEPGDLFGRTTKISVFSDAHPWRLLARNTAQTMAMFNFAGDRNWRHNFAGEPMLFWPIGALFAVGFLRSIIKLFKTRKTHGHLSSVQTLLLSWFVIGLLPVIFSTEGLPHALRAIIVVPVVFIFAAQGLWWLVQNSERWYHGRDLHVVRIHTPHQHTFLTRESQVVVGFAVCVLLAAIGATEFNKYFIRWAQNPEVESEFLQTDLEAARKINFTASEVSKYVILQDSDVLVNPPDGNGAYTLPMSAQTVMFLTDTWDPTKQREKNIFYLTAEQYRNGQYTADGIVFNLNKKP